MANTLTTVIQMLLQPSLKTAFGTLSPIINPNLSLTNGVAIDQADIAYVAERSVVSGTPDVLDLIGGGLIGIDGAAFAPVKIVTAVIYNTSAVAAEILTAFGGANGFNTLLGGTTGMKVGPGGFIVNHNQSLAGWAVTAGTGDLLPISAASGTITYRIGLIGRSA
jgi:hypothetical protein